MTDRKKILDRIPVRTMTRKPEPYPSRNDLPPETLPERFAEKLSESGGEAFIVTKPDIKKRIRDLFGLQERYLNLSDQVDLPTDEFFYWEDGHHDDPGSGGPDLLIVDGLIGVAGNGAVWLTEEKIGDRRYPFISTGILILLPMEQIVADMFEAYRKISLSSGYGVWIAGPSKTADIEQTLVFGAQGSLRHMVFVIH